MRIHLREIVTAHRMALVMATALIWVSPVAQGAILERLKNGENLTVAAIGTSLTAVNWGYWFQPTGDWLNGQGFPGKVTLANRAVCGSASKHEPGTPDYRDGMNQLRHAGQRQPRTRCLSSLASTTPICSTRFPGRRRGPTCSR